MIVNIFFGLFLICCSILLVIFTVFIAKKLIDDILEDFRDDFLRKWGVRSFVSYIMDNSEKEFSAFDLEDRKAICDTLRDIHNSERWNGK